MEGDQSRQQFMLKPDSHSNCSDERKWLTLQSNSSTTSSPAMHSMFLLLDLIKVNIL